MAEEFPAVNKAATNLLMSPITFHMTKFKHEVPIYEYDYEVNKVLFSRMETPVMLPPPEHFGGGAPKGALVKPCNLCEHESKGIQYCETKEMDLFSKRKWVIPRIDER